MLRDDILTTGDLALAEAQFDALVASALGVAGTAWPTDNATGLVKTDDVLIDWPPGRRDNYNLTELNSVANAFSYYGLTAMADIASWIDRCAPSRALVLVVITHNDNVPKNMLCTGSISDPTTLQS